MQYVLRNALKLGTVTTKALWGRTTVVTVNQVGPALKYFMGVLIKGKKSDPGTLYANVSI